MILIKLFDVVPILNKYPTHFRDECSVVDSNCAACTNKAECGFCYVEFANNGTGVQFN